MICGIRGVQEAVNRAVGVDRSPATCGDPEVPSVDGCLLTLDERCGGFATCPQEHAWHVSSTRNSV